ncbi:DUF421 domain-containing protein [Parapedobacter indicus]|uniref:Uncharacterized membrane protein YcaP, DUF421 family n=1 Tax=Parapedobacter indicus TaxID=1477437 RepID=A0A1I3UUJ5_9SPHI|nr:DUF421 domain-containing protein [Parapedobacter indicus]PPK99117.1 uncharacterized membrane protein YcaP (DUF421 family) [Parapedobacter indicus]SFJ85521.1 Uncharacterized membrane protein YcaP, DUF421 family [Parapedobacter indicus]
MDWERIFFHDVDGHFALEVVFRTTFMFVVIMVVLRLSGKRGVRQLSIFELAIILSLGSAAGDPMFYDDVALLPTVLVCATAIGLYRLITWLMAKSERFERILEGEPVYIIEDSVMVIKDDIKDSLSMDEFFAELRDKGVEHLGQVRAAILETNGSMSVFFFPDEEVKYGLPILPHAYRKHISLIERQGLYACIYCGTLEQLLSGRHHCNRCNHHEWVQAINCKRIS